MKTHLSIVTLLIIYASFFSCKKDSIEPDKPGFINPIDSIQSFFTKAENIAGEGTALFSISGVQKDALSNLSCNMNWTVTFIKDHRVILFEIIDDEIIISDNLYSEIPLGHEYLYKEDDRLTTLAKLNTVWQNCISKYKKPILNIDIYAPLIGEKVDVSCFFYTQQSLCQPGEDLFIFNARTGEDSTN